MSEFFSIVLPIAIVSCHLWFFVRGIRRDYGSAENSRSDGDRWNSYEDYGGGDF